MIRDRGDWVHREQEMRVGVRVRHLVIAREVGLIVCWVGEGTVYILQEVDCPHRRTRPESEGKVKLRSGFVGCNVRCPRL